MLAPVFDLDPLVGTDSLAAAPPIVVDLCIFVVSDEGGGGKEARREGSDRRTEARQRKHSPVPKKCGEGWGASVRYAPKS